MFKKTFWDEVAAKWVKRVDTQEKQQKQLFVNDVSDKIGTIPDELLNDDYDDDIEDF